MTEINISKRGKYYTYLKNKKYRITTSIAIINKLANQNIKIYTPDGALVEIEKFLNITDKRPEDWLTQILTTQAARDYFEDIMGRKPEGNEQRFYYPVAVEMVNVYLCGEEIVSFEKLSIQEILYGILNSKPVVVNDKGHMVCVVGFITKQKNIIGVKKASQIKLKEVDVIIIDDPYGDYFTAYRDKHGNDVRFTVNEFNKLVYKQKNKNKKYAII